MQFTLVVLVHSKKPPDRKGTVNVSVSGSISVVVVGRVVDNGTSYVSVTMIMDSSTSLHKRTIRLISATTTVIPTDILTNMVFILK